jgi:hypothetical protein
MSIRWITPSFKISVDFYRSSLNLFLRLKELRNVLFLKILGFLVRIPLFLSVLEGYFYNIKKHRQKW